MQFKRYEHNPPHLFIDGAIYFITGATLNKESLFHDDTRKEFLWAAIKKWFNEFNWTLEAWILFSNHYHIMTIAKEAKDMPEIIRKIHGASATAINRLDSAAGRQVWWNYWDTCLRSNSDYSTHLAYIYWNAVKHGIVARPEDHRRSSFNRMKGGKGRMNFENEETGLKLNIEPYDDF